MSAPITPHIDQEPLTVLPPELHPSVEHLVIEDNTPVDSIYSEKQMRLLTRPLYSSWSGPNGDHLYLALANVGMFYGINQPPLVPDVLLSLGVKVASDMTKKENRSYFAWVFGKLPDVVMEVVSNREGGELGAKKDQYASIGIRYYAVWDPLAFLSSTPLQVFGLTHTGTYESLAPSWIGAVGLGLCVWHGTFEQMEADWLRWCDREGAVIPLGEERAEQERARAEQERARAEKEEKRAEKAEQRLARLEAQLRREGIEPSNGSPQ
jgi:Uma2 family endonuclease